MNYVQYFPVLERDISSIRAMPDNPGRILVQPFRMFLFTASYFFPLIIAGSDLGVFYSVDIGATWQHAGNGVPDALQVFDLEYSPADQNIVAFTHGRGVYKTPIAPFLTGVKNLSLPAPAIDVRYDSNLKTILLSPPKNISGLLTIYTVNGASIIQQKIEEGIPLLLNAANWKAGVYLVQITGQNYKTTKRILVY